MLDRMPSLLGRLDLLRDGFSPGRNVVRGAAAGYESWTMRDVVFSANHVTKIEVTWHPADSRDAEASARGELHRGETLARIETFAGTELIAIADESGGRALLAAIDPHRLDNRELERQAAGADSWRIMPPHDEASLGRPVRVSEDELMESVLTHRAPFRFLPGHSGDYGRRRRFGAVGRRVHQSDHEERQQRGQGRCDVVSNNGLNGAPNTFNAISGVVPPRVFRIDLRYAF